MNKNCPAVSLRPGGGMNEECRMVDDHLMIGNGIRYYGSISLCEQIS